MPMQLRAESASEVNISKFTLHKHVRRNLHVQIPDSDI